MSRFRCALEHGLRQSESECSKGSVANDSVTRVNSYDGTSLFCALLVIQTRTIASVTKDSVRTKEDIDTLSSVGTIRHFQHGFCGDSPLGAITHPPGPSATGSLPVTTAMKRKASAPPAAIIIATRWRVVRLL